MAASKKTRASDPLQRVIANRNLRRVQLAFFGSVTGDWAYATALTVWAYTEGGAAAVGAFTAARFVAMAVAGPVGSVIADKVSRKAFMIVIDLLRTGMVSAAALIVAVDGPSFLVYGLGVLVAMVGAPFRSAQAGLIPKLVSRPDELTASNAVAANLENVATFAGPALGALLVGLYGVEPVFWLNVATYLWSFALVAAIRVPDGGADEAADEERHEDESFLATLGAGFSTVARDGDLRTVSLLAGAQGFVWGALTVFMVIIAIEMLETGPEGVGYLDAVMGGGVTLGGIVVLARVARGRLGQDMAIGVLGWSLPLILLAVFPSPVTAIAALAVIGLADPWVNLGFETIPQRIAPGNVISRVYGAVESALVGAMALGAVAAPALIRWIGFRESMAVVGVLVASYTLTTLRRMRRLDARLAEPASLPLLRSISLFEPLSPGTLETLAHKLEPVSVQAGQPILLEGEASDRFYVIASGTVEVTQAGRLVRTEGRGDFFGEIGLLRDVPRTATVTAATDTELMALEREDFLDAVTGVREARMAADEVVSRRLAV